MKKTGFKQIDLLPEKHKAKISKVSDERNNGDGFWIFLNKHTNISEDSFHGLHTIHENSITECINQLRYAIPCKCEHCTQPTTNK